jgi:autophagy-related protein 2
MKQSAAETAYDVVSPGPSVRRTRTGSRGRRRRQVQPVDIRDGCQRAYQVVREVIILRGYEIDLKSIIHILQI